MQTKKEVLLKKALRKKILRLRNRLSKKQVCEKSSRILAALLSLEELKKARIVHCYISKENEVDTRLLIKKLQELNKKIVVPYIVKNEIKTAKFSKRLKKGPFGILEPAKKQKVSEKNIDIVLFPGVAFDKTGSRIGHGKGYYDKLLCRLGRKTKKIGLAYELQLIRKAPCEKHDAQMDYIVTETKIFQT